MDSFSKVPDSLIHEKNNYKQTQPFQFFQIVAEAFVPEITEATFGCGVHVQKSEMCRSVLRSALRVHERHKAKNVSPKFPEENITGA